MDVTSQLVEYMIDCRFNDIPQEVIDEKKKNLLDTLGVMIAGFDAPGCQTVVDEIAAWGGRKDASIFGYGARVPVHNAAIANCMMARALDFDDVFADSIIHINATNVPVAFAVAEFLKGRSGKELLTAMTVASEFAARMGLANAVPSNISGFSFTFQFGSIIAAIVAGKLMGFSPQKMQNALGIAYSQLAGNNQCYLDGAMTIRLQQGLSAGAGVLGAVLAGQGITGAKAVLEGKFGYYNVFAGGRYDPGILTKDLGRHFYGTYHTLKPYPCCTHLHGAIGGILEMLAKTPVAPDSIEKVTIGVNQSAYNLCCLPLEQKNRPASIVDLQFSFNYVVAAAILDGRVELDHFRQSALGRDDILDFGANKVFPYVDEQGDETGNKSITGTEIQLFLKDGTLLQTSVPFTKGSKQDPMSMAQCEAKFKMCLEKSGRPVTDQTIAKAIEMINNFEDLPDVCELYRLLR